MESDPRRTMLAFAVMVAAVGVACEKKTETVAAAPTEVYVADVIQKDVPVYLDLVGQTIGSQDTELRARVEGVLETMDFREGSFVKQGTLLYQIDRKPLEASLAEAKAQQETAVAALGKADNDVKRYKPLAAKQA